MNEFKILSGLELVNYRYPLTDVSHLSEEEKKEAYEKFADYAARKVPTSGNMRGSSKYRTLLVKVLTRRALEAVGGMTDEN